VALESFFNLPAHPLLVHIPVVCIPIAAVGAVAIAIRPRWRSTYGPLVAVFAAVGMVGAQLAIMSGEALQEARQIPTLGDHGCVGELAWAASIILFGLVVGLFVLDRWRSHPRMSRLPAWATAVVAALTVAGAAGALGTAVLAGHSGAEVVWKEPVTAQGS
jgi:hypothetical protein